MKNSVKREQKTENNVKSKNVYPHSKTKDLKPKKSVQRNNMYKKTCAKEEKSTIK